MQSNYLKHQQSLLAEMVDIESDGQKSFDMKVHPTLHDRPFNHLKNTPEANIQLKVLKAEITALEQQYRNMIETRGREIDSFKTQS